MKKWLLMAVTSACLFASTAFADPVQPLLDVGDVISAKTQLAMDLSSDSAESVASALASLSQIALAEKNVAKAKEYADQLESRLKDSAFVAQLDHKKRSGWFVVSPWIQAEVYRAEQNSAEVRNALTRAEKALNVSNVSPAWKGKIHLELADMTREDDKRSRQFAETASAAYKSAKDVHGQAHAELFLGEMELARGKDRRAVQSFELALKLLRGAGLDRCLVESEMRIADAYLRSGRSALGETHLKAAQDGIASLTNAEPLVSQLETLQKAFETAK